MPAPSISDHELERVAAMGWQAPVTEWLGGWLLRAADGFTGRANSALPLGDPGVAREAALDQVVSWYAARGLPPRMQVFEPARDDLCRWLLTRGAVAPDRGVHVMVAAVADVLEVVGGTPPHPVTVRERPGDGWRSRFRRFRGLDHLPPVAEHLLTHGEVIFAQVDDGADDGADDGVDEDTAVIGIARGALAEGWLGVSAVEVAERHRRRGLATALLGALAGWAADRGAAGIYLQVDQANDVAHEMYRRAGFVDHHTYRYLDLPVTPRRPPTGRSRRRATAPRPPGG